MSIFKRLSEIENFHTGCGVYNHPASPEPVNEDEVHETELSRQSGDSPSKEPEDGRQTDNSKQKR